MLQICAGTVTKLHEKVGAAHKPHSLCYTTHTIIFHYHINDEVYNQSHSIVMVRPSTFSLVSASTEYRMQSVSITEAQHSTIIS